LGPKLDPNQVGHFASSGSGLTQRNKFKDRQRILL
jgi:hypothetical protein